MLKGIDVSHYQGNINWEKVKPQIDFAILRMGLGDDIPSQDDKQFERNYAECVRLGIPFAVYFFSYAVNKAKVAKEIAHIKRLLNGKKINAPVYIDVENTKGLDWRKLSNAELLDIMQEFNAQLNALGYKMGIYSSRSAFWNEKMTDKWYDNISKWVAEYGDKVNNFNRTYDIWQHTSKGRIDGINGNVDMNVMYNSIFAAVQPKPTPTPKPTPAPKPSNKNTAVKEWQTAAIADGFKFPKYGADGVWGAECESVAKAAVCKKRLTYTNRNLTKIVQRKVGVKADGMFGKDTDRAVRNYQKANGLAVDGCVGINTWKKILGI